jgi:small conductance mechanosensitive channel
MDGELLNTAQSWTAQIDIWLAKLLEQLPNILFALFILVIGLILAQLVRSAVRRGFQRKATQVQIADLITRLIYYSLVILVVIAALQQAGLNLTAFLAGLGIAGFTIGFALQDVSKNFVSGILLMIQQPFKMGDTIQVGEYTGKICGISLRATEMNTLDGRLVVIPNADIFTSAIINFSRPNARRIEIQVGVGYRSDLDQVRTIALQAIGVVDGLLAEPAPVLYFNDFGDSAINLTLYYWIDTQVNDVLKAKDQGMVAVKVAFEQAKIDIPYPIQVVYPASAHVTQPVD